MVGLRKTGAVSRMKSIQNWPGDLRLGRWRAEPHQALLEPLGLERPGERLLDDEHDPMAARAQHVADPDAVVGRAEGALGEEDDGARVGHGRLLLQWTLQMMPTHAGRRSAALQDGTQAVVLGLVDVAAGEAVLQHCMAGSSRRNGARIRRPMATINAIGMMTPQGDQE